MIPRIPRIILLLLAGLVVLMRTVSLQGRILFTVSDSIRIDPWFGAALGLLALVFFAGERDNKSERESR